MSHDEARLLQVVSLEPWQNSTPFFGAAAFCTTKIGNFKTSFDVELFDDMVEEVIEEGPAQRDCVSLLYD